MAAPVLTHEQLKEIATQFGTPVYVYDADRITYQFKKLDSAFSAAGAKFFYACKALTNINILRHMKALGTGLDCVSINEVKLGLRAGFAPADIIFSPNCTDFGEYQEAVALGVHINIDNIPMLGKFGRHYGASVPVMIRLNPHIMAGGNLKISTGHADSKFGISIQQMDEIQQAVRQTGLVVKGIHMHTGSEIKDLEVFLDGLGLMFAQADNFPQLERIDLGGGFKVPYKEGDAETDILGLGTRVAEAFATYREETGKTLQVWFEPGKFLVSDCGYLVVKTNVVKQTPARVFAGVNSGFNHLIRPMFYEAYHRIENISNTGAPERTYNVVGNICETDTFAWDRHLSEVREGDLLVFYNAGAYGFEMSSRFNSRLRPAEVLVKNGKFHLVRERDVFEDLLSHQVDLGEI